ARRRDAERLPETAFAVVQLVERHGATFDFELFHRGRAAAKLANQIRRDVGLLRSQKPSYATGFRRLIATDSHNGESAVAELPTEFERVRQLLDARRAPRRPEVDEHDFASVFGEDGVVGRPVDGCE